MRCAWFLLMGGLLLGCMPPMDLETFSTESKTDLVDELVGQWRVEGLLQSDCPQEWKRAMPMGQTRWAAEQGQLVIEPVTGAAENVVLWPVDEMRLFNTATLTVLDCDISETLSLDIESLSPYWASGIYEASFQHDGSEQCRELADEAGVVDQCTTRFHWQARRL